MEDVLSVNTFSVPEHKSWLASKESIRNLIKYSVFLSSYWPKCYH